MILDMGVSIIVIILWFFVCLGCMWNFMFIGNFNIRIVLGIIEVFLV